MISNSAPNVISKDKTQVAFTSGTVIIAKVAEHFEQIPHSF